MDPCKIDPCKIERLAKWILAKLLICQNAHLPKCIFARNPLQKCALQEVSLQSVPVPLFFTGFFSASSPSKKGLAQLHSYLRFYIFLPALGPAPSKQTWLPSPFSRLLRSVFCFYRLLLTLKRSCLGSCSGSL